MLSRQQLILGKMLRFWQWQAVILLALVLSTPVLEAQECPSAQQVWTSQLPTREDAFNPDPSDEDFELPMPCGAKMVLRHVCVPAGGYFDDLPIDLGCVDCGRSSEGFMEAKREAAISGPFTLEDLPESWRIKLAVLARSGDGQCPRPDDKSLRGFYFFIGKYEVTNYQWQAVMDGVCPEQLSAEDPRPKTDISWFEALEFARRYTEWLLKNAPNSLPRFSNKRISYLRLPTEAEWEYAARGGHRVNSYQLNAEDFFPLKNRPLSDYAVFTEQEAAKTQERLAWIGTKCANPLGLFDTAGNAAEMVLDPFRFSLGSRLHGAVGGFIIKGGSYRRGKAEIMPGRREEQPFFLADGAFRSSDVGLRLVLSAILTPENRKESLDRQWAEEQRQKRTAVAGQGSSGLVIEIDQKKDLVAELDRLLESAGSWPEKKNLLYLQEALRRDREQLQSQEADTVKGIVRSALLSAESLLNYSIRRKVILNELSRLEKVRAETVSPSILDSLDSGIYRASETVRSLELATVSFTQFYLDRIKEIQGYSEDLVDSQLLAIAQELSREGGLNLNLKNRLDLFKKHVALYKSEPQKLTPEVIDKDLLSASPLYGGL
jgi:hypothetical protein